MAKALRVLLAVALGIAAVIGVLLFVQSRDRSTFGDGSDTGPVGRLLPDQGDAHTAPPAGFHYATDPPASGPHRPTPVRRDGALTRDQLLTALEAGNVVLVYGAAADLPELRAIQEDAAGPFDPTLASAGQAVILDRRAGTTGVIALGWRRMLQVAHATDPRLRSAADEWLGKGARQ